MIKHFCDVCEKEITKNHIDWPDSRGRIVYPSSIRAIYPTWYRHQTSIEIEVCPFCARKICSDFLSDK